jgi:hypothetical protein
VTVRVYEGSAPKGRGRRGGWLAMKVRPGLQPFVAPQVAHNFMQIQVL